MNFNHFKMNFNQTVIFFVRRQNILRVLLSTILLFTFSHAGVAQEENENQTDAIKIFNLAQDAHEKGRLQDALKLYDEAIKLAPEFPEAEFQRGNALLSFGKISDAEKAFRRAIELREDWTLPMANLGALLLESNRFKEAEEILTKAVELDDKNFPAYVALANLRLKTKAPQAVLKELLAKFRVLTSKANPTVSVWSLRAALERATGDNASAKISLNSALALEPKNKLALFERAEIALSEGDFSGAAEFAKTLNQLSPNSIDIKFLQARILASEGKAAESLKIVDSIANPSAEISAFRNSISAAGSVNVGELEKLTATDPKNASALGRLCSLLRAKNPAKALEYCRLASEAEPNNLNHAVGFAAALVQAKQFEKAVTILKRILQIAPDNYTARANLATALFQLKRYAEAKSEYSWLTEKQPNLSIAYYFLAIVHDNLGQYMDAMANYQQFLKLADATSNKLEIEKVNLRLLSLQRQIKESKGRK
jgi:tetratricopeptide (TPR) repeat protein